MLVACTILFIYKKTDMFKTKEQLFWKYLLSEKDEIVNIMSNDDIKNYSDKLKQSSYIKEQNLSITAKNNLIHPIEMKTSERGNKEKQCKNIDLSLFYDNEEMKNMSIIQDDDYFFIRDNNTDSNFIGIENNNLKQLAQSLGIQNTTFIPNKIKEIDYFKLFSIEDAELDRILKRYIPICRKYVNNKHYSKECNVKLQNMSENVTTYTLDVSKHQLNYVMVNVLKELQNDDDTIRLVSDKLCMIGDDSYYSNVENIKAKIDELLSILSNKETDDDKFLSIIVYKKDSRVIKTDIVLESGRTISVETDGSTVNINQHNVNYDNIDITTVEGTIRTIVNSINNITYTKNVENCTSNKVDLNIICNIGIEKLTFAYNYVEKIENNVDNLVEKNDLDYIDLKNDVEILRKNILRNVDKIS